MVSVEVDVFDWVTVLEVSSVTPGSVAVVSSKPSLVEADSVERLSVLEVESVAANSVAVGSDNVVSVVVVKVSLLVQAEYVEDSLWKVIV